MRLARAYLPVVLMLLGLNLRAAPPKVHTVALGPVRKVPFIAADVSREAKEEEASSLRIRGLYVDDKLREWTTGDQHDITDRSFVTRRVLHINDALTGEKAGRWIWQPGPWILIDRVSGRVTPLHLPDFDGSISDAVWYRDYAAYCGVHSSAKGSALTANVWQIGAHKAALQKAVGTWPQPEHVHQVCAPAVWQREPMRVTMHVSGGEPQQFNVVGTSSLLVEDGEGGEDDN